MSVMTLPDISFDYPKDLEGNIAYRDKMIALAENDEVIQELLKAHCRDNRLFFFNVFLFTYDPRRIFARNIPFITYPFQDESILWDASIADRGKDNLFEKSRDMGVTWICVGNDIHDFLFKQEKIEIRWGSRKEDYVDKRGDMDSIFEKFRHAIKNLPIWMMPKGFSWKEHDNHMRLINPETDSSISGEATNDNFGRGGRKYRIRFDEFAFWACDQAAWQGCADATLCRTALSTPNGPGNRFATLAKSDNIEMKTLHWTLHPDKVKGAYIIQKDGTKVPIDVEQDSQAAFNVWLKNRGEIAPPGMIGGVIRSEWYDNECERRDKDSEVAEELDIDYLRSGFPFFDLRAVSRQVKYTLAQRLTPLESIPHMRYIRASLVDVDNKIEIREQSHGWLKIFEMPLKHGQYVLFGDTAEGLAKGDEAFAVVRDKYTRNVMATCHGAFDPDDFALKLQKIGALYNKCLTAPENNNHGYSVCSDLKQLDCNLYFTRRKDSKGKHVKIKAGFTTTTTTRPQMLDQANEDISKDACEVRDPVIISQMETFVRNEKNGKPEADGDFLDDGVIAFAGAGIIIQEYPYNHKKTKTQDMTKFINRPRNGSFRFKRS